MIWENNVHTPNTSENESTESSYPASNNTETSSHRLSLQLVAQPTGIASNLTLTNENISRLDISMFRKRNEWNSGLIETLEFISEAYNYSTVPEPDKQLFLELLGNRIFNLTDYFSQLNSFGICVQPEENVTFGPHTEGHAFLFQNHVVVYDPRNVDPLGLSLFPWILHPNKQNWNRILLAFDECKILNCFVQAMLRRDIPKKTAAIVIPDRFINFLEEDRVTFMKCHGQRAIFASKVRSPTFPKNNCNEF